MKHKILSIFFLFIFFCNTIFAAEFGTVYTGQNLERVAFPIGGLGAGMYCMEGTGAISHLSVKNQMEFNFEPQCYAAICVLGKTTDENVARVVEGPVPKWKYFGKQWGANGLGGASYGLPRFRNCSFQFRFPFGEVNLSDNDVPLKATVTGWSPFTPPDADSSGLPVGALEYTFKNPTDQVQRCIFSFNSRNFSNDRNKAGVGAGYQGNGSIGPIEGGFVLYDQVGEDREKHGSFAVFLTGDGIDPKKDIVVDHCWFRGGWYDAYTIAWENVATGRMIDNPSVEKDSAGATLAVPFELKPGESKTLRLLTCWYWPETQIRAGRELENGVNTDYAKCDCDDPNLVAGSHEPVPKTYKLWYSTQFASITEVADRWQKDYNDLKKRTQTFTDAFYDSTLPPAIVETIASKLALLKTPTILRQHDGRLWGWEGCYDSGGCCHGSCTHVWTYTQAMCHLFPTLERSMRQTEYFESSWLGTGRQAFRSNLPITPGGEGFDAADGQFGGVMKVYRDWRIFGNDDWLKLYWPRVKKSLDYMIETFDPRKTGTLEETHHNTYDINYFGPDSQCGTYYLGALIAAIEMGQYLGEDVSEYQTLLEKGRKSLVDDLFNGEYFVQEIRTSGLRNNFHTINVNEQSVGYRKIAEDINKQGPKYQYGNGCLSDGVLGSWIAFSCGLNAETIPGTLAEKHLLSVHKYNLKKDLSKHANPQRPSYAIGDDGGLLLCTWPKGGKPTLPFVYSDEVWTGIEYQVCAHLLQFGRVDEALDIISCVRGRYDGYKRNPFDEYEWGHFYIRALSCYGMLQSATGARYDAVTKTLYVDSKVGDFRSFLSTATGFGTVVYKDGKATLEVKSGKIPVENIVVKQ